MRSLTVGVACLTALAAFVIPDVAKAQTEARPYVVLHDDGTLNGKLSVGPDGVITSVMKAYDKTGSARPDVISLWTTFSMNKNDVETLYAPAKSDVKGIGLEHEYGGDGTRTATQGPLRAILLHNNIFALAKRAKLERAPVENFADYLFLLELSHVWGPAARISKPAASGGGGGVGSADELIGFPFHWSFWMDAGGSPAGGNKWKDNGDGSFTTLAQTPTNITYSMLDLYLMGFADASEVPPFGVLQNAVPPTNVTDPFNGKELSAQSFPIFDAPVTVTGATRRTITIDEIIATNGVRSPSRKDAPQSLKLGIVLVVPKDATEADIAKAEAVMDPIATRLAPAFERATRGRGKLDVVTKTETIPEQLPPEEEPPAVESPNASPATSAAPAVDNGCTMTPRAPSAMSSLLGAIVGLALTLVRRSRRPVSVSLSHFSETS